MEKLVNAVPSEMGVDTFEPVYTPFSSSGFSFPFPQLYRVANKMLLFDESALYEVAVSGNIWTSEELDVYDLYSPANTTDILVGGSWHIADFGDSWMAFNGRTMLLKMNPMAITGLNKKRIYAVNNVNVQSGCSHRGRLVIGGFPNEDGLYNRAWMSLLDQWKAQFPDDYEASESLGSNFVFWSSIGGGDILATFIPTLAELGLMGDVGFDSSRPIIDEFYKRGDRGFLPMNWRGSVRCVKPLGKNVVVYGDGGVSVLTPVADPPTFGRLDLMAQVGVSKRGAVGGDDKIHIFITDDGILWSLDAGLNLKKLDYREYLAELIQSDVVISYNEPKKLFYISGWNKCFVLSEQGMCEVTQLVSSVLNNDGIAVGTGAEYGTMQLEMLTEAIDNGLRGIKRVEFVEVGCTALSGMLGTVLYRHDKSKEFVEAPWKPANKEGVFYAGNSGIEYKIYIKVPFYTTAIIEYLLPKWQLVDSRFTRGEYAAETT